MGFLEIIASFCFQKPFHLETGKSWEVVLNISSLRKKYNPCSENVLWSTIGNNGIQVYASKNSKIIIEFSKTQDRTYPWRSCYEEGQLPHLLFWPI